MESTMWVSARDLARLRGMLDRARREARGASDTEGRLRRALVESALLRVANGSYGECVACEEPQELELLSRRPEAPFCMTCTEKGRAG